MVLYTGTLSVHTERSRLSSDTNCLLCGVLRPERVNYGPGRNHNPTHAIARPEHVATFSSRHRTDAASQRVDQIAAALTRRAWNRYSAGSGAKGPREYDWAWVAITPPADEQPGHHWLLIRRRITDGELAFYRCWSPTRVGLPALVRVAGTRWCIETGLWPSCVACTRVSSWTRVWPRWS